MASTVIPSKSKVTSVSKKKSADANQQNNSILSKGRLVDHQHQQEQQYAIDSTKNRPTKQRNLTQDANAAEHMTSLSGKGGYRNNLEMLSSGEEAQQQLEQMMLNNSSGAMQAANQQDFMH